jgi:GT2 family glycosyltransferase
MVSLDIVIVNWNSGKLLDNCLNSIEKSNIKGLLINIVVVDNASCDDSLHIISSNVRFNLIKKNKNIGFAKACNIGLQQSSSKYILFLNPDTEVKENTFQKAVNKMEHNENISVLGVKYIDENGNVAPSCSRFPKVRNYFYDIIGLSKIYPKIFHHAALMFDMDFSKSAFVDEVSGAFYLCRKSVLDRVGGFDERFFVYYEELDLSYRIKKSGGAIFYDADNEIYHKGCGASEQVKAKRLFYVLRSRIIYGFKNYNNINAVMLFILTMFIEPFSRLGYLIISCRFSEINDLVGGYYYLFRYYAMRNKKGGIFMADIQ